LQNKMPGAFELRDATANTDNAWTGWMVEVRSVGTSESRFAVIAENKGHATVVVSNRLRISSNFVKIVRMLTDRELRGLELEAGQLRRMN
jgi:hypothetical protein